MAQHNELGKKGEALAKIFLLSEGFEIVETNFRWQKAEIDLIVKQNDLLIFVEVKTRSTDYFGQPYEAVTKSKQRLMADAANFYVVENNFNGDVRYDVVSIVMKNNSHTIYHIKDAFYPFASDLE